MDKLVLADLQTLIASPDYGGRGFIQPSSAVLGLSAAFFLSDLTLWQGSGYELTEGEIDDIQAMIAQLEEDLMVTGDMYPVEKVKVTNSVAQSISDAAYANLTFNTDIYDPENMHNPASNPARLYVVKDGLHIININIQWAATAGGERKMLLRKWDSVLTAHIIMAVASVPIASGVAAIQQAISFQDDSVIGDYYYASVIQYSGGALDISSTPYSPIFSALRY